MEFSFPRDKGLRQLLANAGKLLGGHSIAAVFGLASVGLTARGLGPESYGIVVLVLAYVTIVDNLLNFQAGQAVIKYGAECLEQDRPKDLNRLVLFATTLDLSSALVGAAVASLAIFAVGPLLGWSEATVRMAALYSLVIAVHLHGTPRAALRLFDRFGVIAVHSVVNQAFRLAAVVVAYTQQPTVEGFLIAWALADVFGQLAMVALGWVVLRREGHGRLERFSPRQAAARFPGILRFVWNTNVESTVRLLALQLDVFLVSAFLGYAGAGLYGVVKQLASIAARVADPLHQAVYPAMARLWARAEIEPVTSYLRRTYGVGFACSLLVVVGYLLGGGLLITLVFGSEFVSVFWPGAIALGGVGVWLVVFAYSPLLAAMGKTHQRLRIVVVSALACLGAHCLLIPHLGLLGAALGFAVFFVVWTALANIPVRSGIRTARTEWARAEG